MHKEKTTEVSDLGYNVSDCAVNERARRDGGLDFQQKWAACYSA
ncbi:hypothetical protein Oter_4525 [Opitutus terrae PB90-1]|uniref:Uncharacterized protein n=1 Tax=Opitutus terrae (strain DSM 11246 / JCM 15787 / PB90-1) TaxID=452637 RepID=B1ZQ75_OPITP|nr:hypothetical protein Oter_4525 [Opitutus terrae PB90-1]